MIPRQKDKVTQHDEDPSWWFQSLRTFDPLNISTFGDILSQWGYIHHMFDVLSLIYICANLHSHKTKLKKTNLVVNFIYATACIFYWINCVCFGVFEYHYMFLRRYAYLKYLEHNVLWLYIQVIAHFWSDDRSLMQNWILFAEQISETYIEYQERSKTLRAFT